MNDWMAMDRCSSQFFLTYCFALIIAWIFQTVLLNSARALFTKTSAVHAYHWKSISVINAQLTYQMAT